MTQENRIIGFIVDDLKREFENYLLSQGYNPSIPSCVEECEIVQYRNRPCQDCEVPVLMADIGANSFEILTIAISTNGRYKGLHNKLLKLFDAHSIEAISFSKKNNSKTYNFIEYNVALFFFCTNISLRSTFDFTSKKLLSKNFAFDKPHCIITYSMLKSPNNSLIIQTYNLHPNS